MFHSNEVCVVKPEDPLDPLLLCCQLFPSRF